MSRTQSSEEGAASWEALADSWSERVRTHTDRTRVDVLDAATWKVLGDVTGKRVLDAGCGEGRFSRMLADRGARVTGIDFSNRMIELARQAEVSPDRGDLGIEYEIGDMANMSELPDASFDVVISYLTILDVEDYEKALSEIARVLVPGGQFVFSTLHPCFNPPGAGWEPRTPGTFPIFDKDKLYKRVDNYFPAREMRFRLWPTAPVETINYHRTLTEYSRALRAAGLLIRQIDEPYPPEELMTQRDYLREWYRAPNMILIDCVKPS